MRLKLKRCLAFPKKNRFFAAALYAGKKCSIRPVLLGLQGCMAARDKICRERSGKGEEALIVRAVRKRIGHGG